MGVKVQAYKKRFAILTAVFLALLVLIATPSLSLAASRVALVIGNAQYETAPLKNPVNDAKDMADTLKHLGFEVIPLVDANREQMIRAINDFGRKLHHAEVGIFYYAGHGMQIRGSNYLIPVNSRPESESDLEFEAVNADRVLGKMRDSGNRLNIIVLDACRDNPFVRSFRSSEKGLARMSAPAGSVLAYATSPDSVAADGDGRNGIYTKHLLAQIVRPDLSIQEMLMETGLQVMKETGERQIPWVSSTPIPRYYLASASGALVTEPAARTDSAMMSLISNVSGAAVSIGGRFVGETPIRQMQMTPGTHHVVVSMDGYDSYQTRVTLEQGRHASLNVFLSPEDTAWGRLFVNTSPGSSRIRIVNSDENYARGMELAPGRYHLHVSYDGYETLEQWVSIAAGEDRYVSMALQQSGEKAAEGPLPQKTAHLPGETWVDPVTGGTFVWVPAGCFMMGQTESEKQALINARGKANYDRYFNDETPRRRVCVDGFWMGKTEVTRGQFRKFITATGYVTDAEKEGSADIFNSTTKWKWETVSGHDWKKPGFEQSDEHPVVSVSYNDATAFADWLSRQTGMNFRLPTEAEREYAARGGAESMYFWGDSQDDACRYANVADRGNKWRNGFPCDDGYQFTAPVGSFRPNQFGLHDMLGNVREWCADWYGPYPAEPADNPTGPSFGMYRVLRGGAWDKIPEVLRSAERFRASPDHRASNIGFRLVWIAEDI